MALPDRRRQFIICLVLVIDLGEVGFILYSIQVFVDSIQQVGEEFLRVLLRISTELLGELTHNILNVPWRDLRIPT